MTYVFAIAAIALLGFAGLLIRQVDRDFFAALEAEYAGQLSRDPAYRKRLREGRRPPGEKARRLLRRGLWRIKMPLYLLAVRLGLRRRRERE